MEKNRLLWISVAQVAASFAVVMLHCNGVFWKFPSGRLWYTSNFIECFFYWAVPVFFMITGATLLDYQKKYSTLMFFRKRIARVALPFIAWSFIGVLYRVRFDNLSVGSSRELIDGIINTKFISIYWYFISLCGVYFCIPFAAAISNEKKNRCYLYASITGFIFSSVLPTTCGIFNIPFNAAVTPSVFNGYILYALIGYVIMKVKIPQKYRTLLYILGILGTCIQFFGTDILSKDAGSLDRTFKGYLNFPAVLQAVGVFILFRYFPYQKLSTKIIRLINGVSKRTFGVYLMHVYFVWQLPRLFHFSGASIYFRTFGAVAIYCICILLCWLISKAPILNKILGC